MTTTCSKKSKQDENDDPIVPTFGPKWTLNTIERTITDEHGGVYDFSRIGEVKAITMINDILLAETDKGIYICRRDAKNRMVLPQKLRFDSVPKPPLI